MSTFITYIFIQISFPSFVLKLLERRNTMKLSFKPSVFIILLVLIQKIDSISDSTLVLPPPIPGQGRPEFPIPPPDEETGFLGPVPGTPQRPSGEIFPNKPPFYPFPISPSEVYEGSKYVPKEEVEGNTEGSSPVRPTWVPIPLPTNKPIYMPIYDPLAPVAPEIRTTTEYVPTPDYDRIFNIFNYEKDEPKRIRLSSSS